MDDRLIAAEEQIAELARTVEDLSAAVHRQEGAIARLERRLELLLSREAEREYDAGGQVPLGDERPPHW